MAARTIIISNSNFARAASPRTKRGLLAAVLVVALASSSRFASAAADVPQSTSSQQIIGTLLANEQAAILHKDHYSYFSEERSDRTGGHLWREKVVETDQGKVRMLLAEDGKPLSPDRIAQERGRLAGIVADPTAWAKKERTRLDDEAHARQLLAYVQKAFLFNDATQDGPYLRIEFRPNPDFPAQTIEERVLHGASGYMLIDPQMTRLHYIQARLPQDVTIGFGLLATIHAGSNFSTTRDRLGQPDWKTTELDTAINGRVVFFKSIARNEHAEHSNFVRVPNDLTVVQAVALAEQP
jgi:hypothetical protein